MKTHAGLALQRLSPKSLKLLSFQFGARTLVLNPNMDLSKTHNSMDNKKINYKNVRYTHNLGVETIIMGYLVGLGASQVTGFPKLRGPAIGGPHT